MREYVCGCWCERETVSRGEQDGDREVVCWGERKRETGVSEKVLLLFKVRVQSFYPVRFFFPNIQ